MLKVLIADDEIWVASLIHNSIHWAALDMEVICETQDGLSTLQSILELKPDIVISDVRMPGMNGIDVVREARRAGIKSHFIIISGYKDFEYVQGALKNDVTDYILKPFDEDVLLESLQALREKILKVRKQSDAYGKMQDQLKKSISELRQKLLAGLLLSRSNTSISIDELNANYKCNFIEGCFQVVFLKQLTPQGVELPKPVVKNIFLQMRSSLTGCLHSLTPVSLENGFAVILNFSPEQATCLQKELACFGPAILQQIGLRYAGNVSLGVGGEKARFDQICESMREALGCANCHLHFGPGHIFYASHMEEQSFSCPPPESVFTQEKRLQLNQILESGSSDKLSGFLHEFFDAEALCHIHPDVVFESALLLLESFHRYISRLNDAFATDAQKPSVPDIYLCGSIQELATTLFEYMASLLGQYACSAGKIASAPVQKAKEYISVHYNEKITLQDVADTVYLNPQYLCELFKQETGINFSDYIADYRIQVAKDLLRDPQYKIKDINYMVGYKDSKSFTKLFKKTVGISPMEYRKIHHQ